MRVNFNELEIKDKLLVFSDGQEVFDYIEDVLNYLKQEPVDFSERPIQPISLLLLDINMPNITGLEALKMIKQKYREVNEELVKLQREEESRERHNDAINTDSEVRESKQNTRK